MSAPLLCAENLLDTVVQFPDHVLTAEEEASGYEVWHVADGRRDTGDAWLPTTANSQTYLTCVFDRVRCFDFVALDRGHNLAGYGIDLLCTQDATDFSATYETPIDLTIPAYSAPGDVDDALGVLTEEGAWVKRFDARWAKAVRFRVDAMGAGLLPQVVGLWLGKSWEPNYFTNPLEDETHALIREQLESGAGWRGYGKATRRRQGTLTYHGNGTTDDDFWRYHVGHLFGSGAPMWLIHDQSQADRAVLAELDRDVLGFGYSSGWGWRQGQIPWIEHEAKP